MTSRRPTRPSPLTKQQAPHPADTLDELATPQIRPRTPTPTAPAAAKAPANGRPASTQPHTQAPARDGRRRRRRAEPNVQLNVRIPPRVKDALIEAAEDAEMDIGAYVQQALIQQLGSKYLADS